VLEHPDAIAAMGERCRSYVSANFDSRDIVARYHELLLG